MSNVTSLKRGGTATGGGSQSPISIIRHTVDIADAVTAGLLTTEYIEIQTIPAGTSLTIYGMKNATVLSLGSGPRLDLGDGDDDDLYVTNSTTETVDAYHTLTGESAMAATTKYRKTYTTAGSLRLKVTGGTIASGKVTVIYSMVDIENENLIAEAS